MRIVMNILGLFGCIAAELGVRFQRPWKAQNQLHDADSWPKKMLKPQNISNIQKTKILTLIRNFFSSYMWDIFDSCRDCRSIGTVFSIFSGIFSMMHRPGPSKFVARCMRLSAGPQRCKEPFWNLKMYGIAGGGPLFSIIFRISKKKR